MPSKWVFADLEPRKSVTSRPVLRKPLSRLPICKRNGISRSGRPGRQIVPQLSSIERYKLQQICAKSEFSRKSATQSNTSTRTSLHPNVPNMPHDRIQFLNETTHISWSKRSVEQRITNIETFSNVTQSFLPMVKVPRTSCNRTTALDTNRILAVPKISRNPLNVSSNAKPLFESNTPTKLSELQCCKKVRVKLPSTGHISSLGSSCCKGQLLKSRLQKSIENKLNIPENKSLAKLKQLICTPESKQVQHKPKAAKISSSKNAPSRKSCEHVLSANVLSPRHKVLQRIMQQPEYNSLDSEDSDEQVTFVAPPPRHSAKNTTKLSKRRKSRQLPMTEVLKHYLEVAEKVAKITKKRRNSKRLLYSAGQSDMEKTPPRDILEQEDSVESKATVRCQKTLRMVSPPPPLAPSVISRRSSTCLSGSTASVISPSRSPTAFADSTEASNLTTDLPEQPHLSASLLHAESSRKRTRLHSPLFATCAKFDGTSTEQPTAPTDPLGLRRSQRKRRPGANFLLLAMHRTLMETSTKTNQRNKCSSIKSYASLIKQEIEMHATYAGSVYKDLNQPEKLARRSSRYRGHRVSTNQHSTLVEANAQTEQQDFTIDATSATAHDEKTSESAANRLNAENQPDCNEAVEQQEHSARPNVEHSALTSASSAQNIREVRVRLKRLTLATTPSALSCAHDNTVHPEVPAMDLQENIPAVHPCSRHANVTDFISWLTTTTDAQSVATARKRPFKEMHCSLAAQLEFQNIDGIDYAFYDTSQKFSLGYLRFKPGQHKPNKRIKSNDYQFIVLTGIFNFYTAEVGRFNTGDLITLKKGSSYAITNISDKIGVLLVSRLDFPVTSSEEHGGSCKIGAVQQKP